MKNILITGGTVFVSRYAAEYYVKKGYNVFVLNRNSKAQSKGVSLIEADRHNLGSKLLSYHFDVILDITAYTSNDVEMLLGAVGEYEDYILISSSAVYPEYCLQPFNEQTQVGENKFWGKYGTDKIGAEHALIKRNPGAYILRPPYLYGPMNNLYREAFVFECAVNNRKFYLPMEGRMKLQFLHVNDLCRFIDIILEKKPTQRIFNVGNNHTVSVREWASMCYKAAGKNIEFVNVESNTDQRSYFSFYNYEYYLDVTAQNMLMPETKELEEGLRESFEWYLNNSGDVRRKPFIEYIDFNFA